MSKDINTINDIFRYMSNSKSMLEYVIEIIIYLLLLFLLPEIILCIMYIQINIYKLFTHI